MNVASLELCKELSDLSGWAGIKDLPRTKEMSLDYFNETFNPGYGGIPRYTLGYLLRKLPAKVEGYSSLEFTKVQSNIYIFRYGGLGPGFMASCDIPEDAACKLVIELFKQGILKEE
jgi:hypothetical protein